MKKLSTRVLTIYCIALVVGSALLIAAAPLQDETPAPPEFVAAPITAALVVAATAFAKERLKLTGNNVTYAAFGICAVIFLYPFGLALLPESGRVFIESVVNGLVVPFLIATGGYDFVANVAAKLKPKTT